MIKRKILLVIYFILMLVNELQSRPEVDWFDSINTRLRDSRDVHTAVIIDDPNAGDPDPLKDGLFEKIIGSMSSLIVRVDDGGIELEEPDFGISKLSTSLLFIFYTEYSGDNAQIYQVMNSTNQLADFAMNYLLIILRTSSDSGGEIEDILQNAWNDSILNIVIVEIRLATNFNRFPNFFAHSKFYNDNSSQVIIHQFNPFINKTYCKQFSTGMDLFPNFSDNMYGHSLHVLFLQRPPFSVIELNQNNTIKSITGPNFVLMQTLAKKLNFSLSFAPVPEEKKFRSSNVSVEERFETLQVDIAAYLAARYVNDTMEEESLRSRNILTMELGVLMPKKYEINRKSLSNTLKSGAITFVIIMIIWFVVILLKFDAKIWQLCSIFRLIVTNVVPHQPSRTHERILFLFVAMLGFMYSNDIYTSVTNLGVDHLVEDKYETLEEIDDSGLKAFVWTQQLMNIFSDVLGKDSKLQNQTGRTGLKKCLQKAKKHRNVCCVIYRQEVEYYSSKIEQLRFAEPILQSDDAAFLFRQDLPGREKMNQIIQRCEETGHLGKWYWNRTGPLGHKVAAKDDSRLRPEMLHKNLLKQLTVIIVFGHI